MKRSLFIIGIAFMLTYLGCSTRTVITAQWQAPEPEAPAYRNLFIASLMDDLQVRQNIENEYENRLANRGVGAIKSLNTFRPGFLEESKPNREQLLEIIQSSKADGILTVTLLDTEEEQRWVPGGPVPMFAPMGRFGFYGTFPGYFDRWYGTAWNTGYYTTDKKYFIETNLYDAESLELVWSAQSRTYNSTDLASIASDYVDAIKKELRENKLIQ
ncbi:hypothetical protein [Negadavirga shengliensis]|uniref:DUF4136 domain-containing protein n=1 Tax=Negadavirga shengliensis TaxID=1389218 RepID=A0ABV9T3P4_9BACT